MGKGIEAIDRTWKRKQPHLREDIQTLVKGYGVEAEADLKNYKLRGKEIGSKPRRRDSVPAKVGSQTRLQTAQAIGTDITDEQQEDTARTEGGASQTRGKGKSKAGAKGGGKKKQVRIQDDPEAKESQDRDFDDAGVRNGEVRDSTVRGPDRSLRPPPPQAGATRPSPSQTRAYMNAERERDLAVNAREHAGLALAVARGELSLLYNNRNAPARDLQLAENRVKTAMQLVAQSRKGMVDKADILRTMDRGADDG
jgi:hypothetical protein